MCEFSGNDFDEMLKLFRTVYCKKKMAKRYESVRRVQTPAMPRADSSIQERKEFERKIKLEIKLTDRCYNYLLKVNIKNTRKRYRICSKLT